MRANLHTMLPVSKEFSFTPRDFSRVRNLIYKRAGIALGASKQEMVYSRLVRRLRATGIDACTDYLDTLEQHGDSDEWEAFVNALTTNLTAFFREAHHFPVLAGHLKHVKAPINIWCCAASSGEEPYSIAMTACEAFGTLTPPVRIMATDIDTNVLRVGEKGIYAIERLGEMSKERIQRFFLRGKGSQAGKVRVRHELRQMISFRPLNLLADPWEISGPFDAIFCRNTMIYFDKPTQGKILSRFAPLMKSDALLFAGHSENFIHTSNVFRLLGKTVYELAPEYRTGDIKTRCA